MGALGRVTGFWEGLTGPSRRLVIGAAVIFIIGVFALMKFSGQESYATLATPSSASDAAAITSQLDELGIRYKLAEGGGAVQVPSSVLDQARIDLAASNVLDGGGIVGFEIFDKSNLGATDFTNRVNLLRAREGDLSRILGRLEPVQSATVKLAMPEEQLFTEDQEATTAAVVLTMKAGQTLEPGQVKGIAKLVAMAVPGMKVADVTITDSQGNILEGADAEVSGASAASQRIQIEGQYERSVQGRLDAMLAATLGPGKAVTQVRASLDLDKVTTDSETFEGDTIPLETETSEETLTSQGGASAGAPAGASANTPAGTTFPAGATGNGNGNTDYSKTAESTRNGVDRIRSQVEKTPGAVTKQTVSVQVSDEVPAAVVSSLEDSIKSAVGFDADRGDTISVAAVPFAEDGTAVTEAASAAAEAKNGPAAAPGGGLDIMGLTKTAAAGIGLLLLAFFARRSLRRRQTDLEKALPELLKRGPVSVAELAAAGAGGGPVRQLEGQRKSAIEAQMEDLAKRKPDDVAQLLRGWLLENGR